MRIDIFEDYIPEPNSGCWLWLNGVNSDGYSCIRRGGISKRVHRLMWERFNGPIPESRHVCHRCDVRSCINPAHLFIGTPRDNYEDMVAKGRKAKFDYQALSPLTSKEVTGIRTDRRDGMSFSKLAKRYDVSVGAVWKIVHFQSWRHV